MGNVHREVMGVACAVGMLAAAGCFSSNNKQNTQGSSGSSNGNSGGSSGSNESSGSSGSSGTNSGSGSSGTSSGSQGGSSGDDCTPPSTQGLATPQVWASNLYMPEFLALDANGQPYWLDSGPFGATSQTARLMTASAPGGSGTVVDTNPPDTKLGGGPMVIQGGTVTMESDFGLFQVPAAGGTATQTVTDGDVQDPKGLVSTSVGFIYTSAGNGISGVVNGMPVPIYTANTVNVMTQYGGNLYFVGGTDILELPITASNDPDASAPTTIFASGGTLLGLNADASGLYYYENNSRTAYAVTYAGVQTMLYAAGAGVGITGLVVDETYAYITTDAVDTPGEGQVLRVAKTGGCPEVLATNLATPMEPLVSSTAVFWVNEGLALAGSVNSLSK